MKPIHKRNLEHPGVLGYGQVGRAVAKLYDDPAIQDQERDDGLEGIDVLNVCIPYSEEMAEIILRKIQEYQPTLTIIHSTVAPGTTKEINDYLEQAGKHKEHLVVHSPVRGVHPDLYEGLQTFTKYIGADVLEGGILAEKHLRKLGLHPKAFGPSVVTELGKLFSTTYYGLCIAWHGEMNRICEQHEIEFSEAVSHFNQTYNEGYEKLEKENVIRPELYPPPEEGIGGHCIVDNVGILRQHYPSKVWDLILEYAAEDEKEEVQQRPIFY